MAQEERLCLPVQETQARFLIREDPTCRGATEPVGHSSEPVLQSRKATAAEPRALEPCSATREATAVRSRAPQLENSPHSNQDQYGQNETNL